MIWRKVTKYNDKFMVLNENTLPSRISHKINSLNDELSLTKEQSQNLTAEISNLENEVSSLKTSETEIQNQISDLSNQFSYRRYSSRNCFFANFIKSDTKEKY